MMSRTSHQALYLSVVAAIGAAVPSASQARIITTIDPRSQVPEELIIRFKDSAIGTQATAFTRLAKTFGANSISNVNRFMTDKAMNLVRISQTLDTNLVLENLRSMPGVEFAEPNYRFYALDDGIPNDPDFAKTWGLKNTGQTDSKGQVGVAGADIHIVPLWLEGFHGSRNVLVAVIDTGIDWTHPDLAANLYTNPGEAGDKASNGKDDDGNGFIDDIHGWNFVSNNNDTRDDDDHGSHTSGTIGAVGNNGIGVSGVNWEVSLLPVKFLGPKGGGDAKSAIEAINYARMMKVKLMSNSWGGDENSIGVQKAIEAARDAGILFVVSAGNSGLLLEARPTYPASYTTENILSVAATHNQDSMASFSNYSPFKVHVAAPGVNVLSTVRDGKYASYSGTSMAAPHVSGIAALLWSANPSWTYSEIKDRIMKTSDPVLTLKSRVIAHGRVNAYNAFHGIVTQKPAFDEKMWKTLPTMVESKHPYDSSIDADYTIRQPGARFMRVHFTTAECDPIRDQLTVRSGKNEIVDDIAGPVFGYYSDYVEGDTLVIHLKSDYYMGLDYYGFKVDQVQYIE